MSEETVQYCPLFPGLICPRGAEAAEACEVRVNGNFDPVLYFKDHRQNAPGSSNESGPSPL